MGQVLILTADEDFQENDPVSEGIPDELVHSGGKMNHRNQEDTVTA